MARIVARFFLIVVGSLGLPLPCPTHQRSSHERIWSASSFHHACPIIRGHRRLWYLPCNDTFFVGLFVSVLPGFVGEHAGKKEASAEQLRLLGPVSRGDTELWEKGERKIRGHIIASSSELIAIYDIDLHQVRTLSRGDWEIRRVTP
ncbi:hypothetical protein RMA73_03300 [Xanthomonas translucens pv. translucens]|uniref:hypothetical protein n=1 Tax=Xanthomonas campestris pv. translucens TaxID=343 RepID=UPI00288C53E0|nr:hypothetical protein [Xanthomonas translucens]WNJ27679.1 hypothetical protein RMA73_03300 [Xanthomonas translucens pv. translucens]